MLFIHSHVPTRTLHTNNNPSQIKRKEKQQQNAIIEAGHSKGKCIFFESSVLMDYYPMATEESYCVVRLQKKLFHIKKKTGQSSRVVAKQVIFSLPVGAKLLICNHRTQNENTCLRCLQPTNGSLDCDHVTRFDI